MLVIHDPRCADYGSSMRPEQPSRVVNTASYLLDAFPGWTWETPGPEARDEMLLLAHTREHVSRLAKPRDFDADTPYFPEIGQHARRGVACAGKAAGRAVRDPRAPVSLMRPPGHHATAARAMGFCYLNQVAIAALAARRDLGAQKVAIWDFDAHHGNGTEDILHSREGFLFCSVHQSPCYPGTGLRTVENCHNWPVAPHAPRHIHMAALLQSFEAVMAFKPDLVLVSAGFDAYAGDPITEMSLEIGDFATLGKWLRQSGLPAAAALEGGYSPDLPKLVGAFLEAWEGP
jgi:acetoin utilization deacetylase AcuC-like enzyme